MEAQARGFAHGHGKVHSIPNGTRDLLQCLDDVVQEIEALQAPSHVVGFAITKKVTGVVFVLRFQPERGNVKAPLQETV